MAKPRIPNQKQEYSKLNRRLAQYVASVQRLYAGFNAEAARIAISTGHDGETPFSWKKYPQTSERVRKLQEWFMRDLGALVMAGTTDEWKRSNVLQDMIADKVMRAYHVDREGGTYDKYYRDNSDALRAFQSRREGGMNISDKLWEQSKVYKNELEDAIGAAIERGTDAITLSKQISKYLIDFPSLQKDYKKKFGKACKSHDCEYRSIRLARSEINMAYRTSEQARWQQFDFVIGYEIKTSGSHPASDVCDRLKGKYPKDFVWTGWHPNCMCYAVPILKTEEEFFEGKSKSTKESPSETVKNYIAAYTAKGGADYHLFEEYDTLGAMKETLQWLDNAPKVDGVELYRGTHMLSGDIVNRFVYGGLSEGQVVTLKDINGEDNGSIISFTRDKDRIFSYSGYMPEKNPDYDEFENEAMRLTIKVKTKGGGFVDIQKYSHYEVEQECITKDTNKYKFINAEFISPSLGWQVNLEEIADIEKEVATEEVTDVPQVFKDWCKDNWFRICDAKQNGTLPYFIDDNFSRYAENYEYLTKEDAVKFQKDKWIGEFVKVDYVKIAKERGFTDDEISEVQNLIDNHRIGEKQQEEADLLIRYYMNEKDSRIGDLLRLHSDIEEEAYRAYRLTHKNMYIVRKGSVERDSLSYSKNPNGAFVLDSNFERHYLTPDSSSTVDEMLKEFRLVGGMNDMYIGYAEDSELFFVRKERKYNKHGEFIDFVEEQKSKRDKEHKSLKGSKKEEYKNMLNEFKDITFELGENGKIEELKKIVSEVNREESIDGYNSLKNFLDSTKKERKVQVDSHVFTAEEIKRFEEEGWDIREIYIQYKSQEYERKNNLVESVYELKADALNKRLGGLDVSSYFSAIESACDSMGITITEKRLSDKQIVIKGNGFEMTRFISVEIDGNGRKHYIVNHSLFDLADDYQNHGLSKKIFAEHFKLYQKAGYDEVRLRANRTVGGYCWAKYGALCKKDGPGGVREMVALQREKGLINDVQYVAINKVIDESGEFVQMQKIAFIDGAEKFLKGTNWDGFIDLKSEEQMEYIYSYLGIR